ncbi:hypothetical protein AgCh_008140 [Apium graveolens]
MVWRYAHELKKVLPESTIKVLTENPDAGAERGRFLRFYVCLQPLKIAFMENCRKLVGLDDFHLKGPYGGQLLAVVGVDANDKEFAIYPSAKKIDKTLHYVPGCVVTWSKGTSCSVTCSEGGHELVVNLAKKSCTCRKWELTGIPCYHACACIQFRNVEWHEHVNDYYEKESYMKLYSYTLEPIVGPEFWEDTPEPLPLPPLIKVQTGRPKKKRIKKNDIPKDATKLPKFGAKLEITEKEGGGGQRTDAYRAQKDGGGETHYAERAPTNVQVPTTKDKVKTKVVGGEASKGKGKRLATEALKVKEKEVTILRELEAAKRAKQSDAMKNQQGA